MAVAGAHIMGCAGPGLSGDEAAFFRDADPWGFILFDRNLQDAPQIRRLTAALRDSVGRDAPILIDQEGGRVQRLRPPLAQEWPAPLDHVRTLNGNAERGLWLRYRLIAAELRDYGIDVNCAPIADIASDATHPVLLNRCYGTSRDAVVPLARAVADGLLAGGVLPVLKHIPGHGRATADSHLELPRVETPAADLSATDFAAFRALSDLPLGMTAHVVYSALDDRAATVAPPLFAAIRGEMDFDGLLMSDDISMSALHGGIADRAAAAIEAGCDVILHCNGDLAEMQAVAAAAGRMSPAAARRADAALARRTAPDGNDPQALAAELATLGGGHV